MNKLYKYLPFSINCITKKYFDYADLEGVLVGVLYEKDSRINALITKEDNTFEVLENDVKPILRPFEDLTKELPLTKAAAEMIGMNEGELIIPIVEFFKLVLEPCVIGRVDLWQWDDISYDKNRKCVKLLSLNGSRVYLYEDWYLEISTEKNVIDETPFDFLRAMHFAVSFSEDEYIKLED